MNLHDVFNDATLERRKLGELAVVGHRVGAADPLITPQVTAFTQRVPTGTFPVEVLIRTKKGDQRVALARLVFRDEAPARFVMAVNEGQDVRTLKDSEIFGYGVDAGTGCFASPSTTLDGEALLRALQKSDVNTWSWAVMPGVVAFSSGYGDGFYPSYFGLDANDEPVCLVTDFGIIDVERPAHRTDPDFRRQAAEALLGELEAGASWAKASELGALKEAAAPLVPRLAKLLAKSPDEMRADMLAKVLGDISSTTAGADALMWVMNSLRGEHLAAVLERRRGSESLSSTFGSALAARWEQTSSPRLRLAILRTLGTYDPHPSFVRLAEAMLRAGAPPPKVVDAAVRPFRVRAGNSAPAHVAPPSLLDALARLPKLESSPHALDTLALQGRADAVRPFLTAKDAKTRAAAAIALRDEPTLRALVEQAGLDEDLRFDCAAHLRDPQARCAAYVKLGLDGSMSAPLQLRYMSHEAPNAVMDALAVLAKRASSKDVRDSAEKALEAVAKT